jgi:flavin reductase (DIM6/NTAB) family NADH-FMN oxidoreductase RutF/rubredoxin
MINRDAFYKITYGLYIVCSGDKNKGNGFISNTFFQVTSTPPRFATCCNKDNYTAELIEKHGVFSVSVLHQNTDAEVFGKFGYKSGRDIDKLAWMDIKYGVTGTPIVLNDSLAYFEFKVVQKTDVGSHWLFIGELLDSGVLDSENEPITYSYYREVIKGVSPKNAPTYIEISEQEPDTTQEKYKRYECSDCGYIYDEKTDGVRLGDLPDNWRCPVCGAAKSDFIEL